MDHSVRVAIGKSPAERVVAGRYRSARPLRDHGPVTSFLGYDDETGSPVVIKILPLGDSYGQVVGLATHAGGSHGREPSVAAPLHVATEAGEVVIVRPFVPGESMEDRLSKGPMPVPAVVAIGIEVFGSLDRLHRSGTVHGNLRPSNVIIGVDAQPPRVTLVDESSGGIEVGALSGVQAEAAMYLSPEQAGLLNERVGPASDLYAVGLLLFECLAGHPAHPSGDVRDVLRNRLLSAPPRLRDLGVAVPRVLDELIQRLMRKDPLERYGSAAGALADLVAIDVWVSRAFDEPPVVIGSSDVRSTLTRAGYVGRAAELNLMDAHIARAFEGHGGLVLVEAPSGGGKTRLLDELAARASARGAWVLRGGVQETGGTPFELLSGVVAGVVAAASDDAELARRLRKGIGDRVADARIALPDLAVLLGRDDAVGPEVFGETRTIEALAALLEALGTAERPTVVLLDDCQWNDDQSTLVLRSWARRAEAATDHVLVVAAFRSEEVGENDPLRALPSMGHVEVDRLTDTEVGQLVSSAAGPVPSEAAGVIVRLAEGSPFMVEAVLRGMVESGALRGDDVGWTVDDIALADVRSSRQGATLLQSRLARLSPSTIRFLSAGAILGRDFDVSAAATLSEVDVESIGRAVDAIGRSGIGWVEEGRCRFVHDKLRDAVLQRLDDQERLRLHLGAATQLTREANPDPFAVAHHFDAAGSHAQALPYALASADDARARHALEIAERQYRIAARGAVDTDGGTRRRAEESLGDVLMLRGQYDEAAEHLERGRELCVGPTEAARIEGKLGELAFKRGDVRTAGTSIERALRILGRRVPGNTGTMVVFLLWEFLVQVAHSALPGVFVGRRPVGSGENDLLAARLHSRLGYAWWFERGKLPTLWTHLRSLNLAERYEPTPELAQAYSEHAPAMMLVPWLRRGIAYAHRSYDVRIDLGDPWGQGQSLHFLGAGLYAASRFRESLEATERALRLLERTGDQWEVNNCLAQVAMCRYRLGDLSEAVEASRAAHRAGVEIGDAHARGIGLEAWAKSSAGRVPKDLIDAELEASGEDTLTRAIVMQAEGVRLLDADPGRARAAFEAGQELFREAGMKNAGVTPIRPWLLTALRREAESTSIVARRRRATLLRSASRIARQAMRRARVYRNDLPHVLRERGHLAALAGRPRRSRRLFDRSVAVADLQDARYEALRTRIARGEVGAELGWTDVHDDAEQARQELRRLLADTGGETIIDRGSPTLGLADRFDAILGEGRRIASALDADEILGATREAAQRLLRGEQCVVVRVSSAGDGVVEFLGADDAELDVALLTSCVETGRPVRRSDDEARGGAGGSALAAPISVREGVVACLYASHREVATLFGEEEERLASFICTLAGAALDNARGFAEITALSRTLERRIEERTAELSEANLALEASMHDVGRANEELRELDRLKDEFLSMVSHELRTPLTSVLGYASTIIRCRGSMSDDEIGSCLEIIERQGRRLLRLVENLLQVSRIESGAIRPQPRPCDVATLIREAVQGAGLVVDVNTECEPGLQAMADPDFLTEILINFLANAARHGRPPIDVEARAEGDCATITVTDAGDGVPEAFVPRLFDRFTQAGSDTTGSPSGSGLGLSIARGLARAQGGDVWYERREPSGSRVGLRLPIAR
jgi:signal transduction histidine kinase/tetratricopeptide (TPR) repeat protein